MFMELYREEKRRGRKETEVARRIKGGIKRRETDPASNQVPKCSPPSGTHREVHGVPYRSKEGGRRCDQEERRGSQKERDQSSL